MPYERLDETTPSPTEEPPTSSTPAVTEINWMFGDNAEYSFESRNNGPWGISGDERLEMRDDSVWQEWYMAKLKKIETLPGVASWRKAPSLMGCILLGLLVLCH